MKETSVKNNFILNLIYKIVCCLIPIVVTPYSARVFLPEGIGIQSYTNSIVSYFVLFAVLGTAVYGTREIARNREDIEKTAIVFLEIEVMRMISTLVSLAIWVLVIIVSDQYSAYYMVLSIQIFNVACDITWFFEGLENYKLIVSRNILLKICDMFFLLIFITRQEQLLLYMLVSNLITLIGNIICWPKLIPYFNKENKMILNPKRHFRSAFGYFIPTIAISIYTVLDKSMIGILTDSEAENGYYEQAKKILDLGHTAVITYPIVLSPRISNLMVKKEKEELERRFNTIFEYYLIFSVLAMAGIISVASQFVPWYLGEEYREVIQLLYVMSPLIVIIGLSGTLGYTYLTPAGKRAQTTKAVMLGAGVNFILNCILIPRHGAIGAGFSSVIAEVVVCIGYMKLSREVVTIRNLLAKGWKKGIAALGMVLIICLVPLDECSPKTTIVQALFGVCVYLGVLLVLHDNTIITVTKYMMRGRKNEI